MHFILLNSETDSDLELGWNSQNNNKHDQAMVLIMTSIFFQNKAYALVKQM